MWAQLMVALAGAMATRAAIAVGIGWITYAGFTALVSALTSSVLTAWGGLSGSTLQFLALSGANTAIGIVLGAYAVRATLVALPRLGKVSAA
ncbi:MAG: DUF2523 domain-containing protein [Gammaproteobacteria bacterium]|nr:DUF2523 domain-containing protein [Gammaproteobacteria bacterium]